MKRLVFAVLAAAVLWSGYWFLQSWQLRGALEGWFEDRRQDGWEASYSDLAIRGFPNRLDVTLSDLTLANPNNGRVWRAPFFQMLSLVYNPDHWILAWPETQTLATPDGEYVIDSQGLRASVVTDGPVILRANLESEVLNIAGPHDLAVAGLNAGIAVDEADAETLRIGLDATSIAGSQGALAHTGTVDALTLRARVRFDSAWTRDALKETKPQPVHIDLAQADYRADRLQLMAAGNWDVDAQGRLDGTATLRAVNWRDLLDSARNSGDLPDSVADFLTDSLGLIAQLSGNRETLDLDFRFNRGAISLGIIPLGQAPRIRLP